MASKTQGAYVVPTAEQAEFKKIVQRANRRILSNRRYLQDNGIKDPYLTVRLVGDYSKKKAWATQKSPLSSSTRFESEAEYRDFMRFINRWGEDRGKRGDFAASPESIHRSYREHIYSTLNGLASNRGISLEAWGGDLPPDIRAKLDGLTLEQITRFYDYVDPDLGEQEFDSEQVGEGSIEDYTEYIDGRLSALQRYYPKKLKKKKKSKKASRKKKK